MHRRCACQGRGKSWTASSKIRRRRLACYKFGSPASRCLATSRPQRWSGSLGFFNTFWYGEPILGTISVCSRGGPSADGTKQTVAFGYCNCMPRSGLCFPAAHFGGSWRWLDCRFPICNGMACYSCFSSRARQEVDGVVKNRTAHLVLPPTGECACGSQTHCSAAPSASHQRPGR